MADPNRRNFLKQSLCAGGALLAADWQMLNSLSAAVPPGYRLHGSLMKLGLVTYLWGQDWNLPTLIKNCEKTQVLGVELRTQRAHKVEANLNAQQRKEVKKRFDDSPVVLVGMGCNFDFHHTDPAKVKQNIEGAQEYVKLSYDCGGSGVKVKPNSLPKGVPVEKTCEQIGKALNVLGKFAADYKQEIRVEVHGAGTSDLPVMKKIFDHVTVPSIGVCWNCNEQDLQGKGLEYNFNLVQKRFATTVHVRELNVGSYPYQQLMNLFVRMDYKGWILLECRTKPKDRIKALIEQREVFARMIANGQKGLSPVKIKKKT
jgi:sugar phosphate isomerase/epimerase